MTCACAAEEGNLDCLRYAHEQGCPWGSDTCAGAAAGGHLSCLQYAHKHGCAWNSTITWKAAQHGHLECFKYALLNGCPLERIMHGFFRDKAHPKRCLSFARELESFAVKVDGELLPAAVVTFALIRNAQQRLRRRRKTKKKICPTAAS